MPAEANHRAGNMCQTTRLDDLQQAGYPYLRFDPGVRLWQKRPVTPGHGSNFCEIRDAVLN